MAEYKKIDDETYYAEFGVSMRQGELGVTNEEKLKAALERAWLNRDFEINKFWSRSAFYWGFLILNFTGYFQLLRLNNIDYRYIEFLMICSGIVFSVAWIYSIKGSKNWQENWEMHIDKLEDYVSGPIYKTVMGNRNSYYSVSRINEIIGWMVLLLWGGMLYDYFERYDAFPWSQEVVCGCFDMKIVLMLGATSVFVYKIIWGAGKSKLKVGKDGVFYRRR